MTNPNTPVLVGVGQIMNKISSLDETKEPLAMMLGACRLAEADTGTSMLAQVQSVRVIRGVWNYENPARYIADAIGAAGAQTVGTLFGGNQNQAVVNQCSREILAGAFDLILITGAENGYSAAKARKTGVSLPATPAPGSYDVLFGAEQKPEHHEFEVARGIQQAIQAYPMYDNAIRHHRGETIDEHLGRVSSLWSRFNDVACQNPHAWIGHDVSAEEIRTPSASNRRVSFPYTKLMNANNAVDMGAALIMCSVARARALGIDESLWVYPHAGVEGQDHFSASVRENFYSSPGIRLIGERLFGLVDIRPDDLAHVDLYSCFPAAVQVAAAELGLDESRPLTVTGGLTFGGGPLNNYVMHSIARMVTLLREDPGSRGLITANGGNLYKHAHAIYSAEPPAQDFQYANVQDAISRLPSVNCIPTFDGDVEIESYTVMYGADGPRVAHVACRTGGGERTWINCNDPAVMEAMTREEFCGRQGHISNDALAVH
jgi:acetyl-CoA C-acetyltransferase